MRKVVVLSGVIWAGAVSGQAITVQTPADVRTAYEADQIDVAPIPDILRQALYISEDKQIYDRFLLRSPMLSSFSRMMFHTEDKTILRIAEQYSNAVLVANALTTDEFLNWYAQKTHFGLGCDGVQDAAMAYFGKPVAELTLEDAAYLAALPKAPYAFHPIRNADRAIKRRNFVIIEMRDAGVIDAARAESAMQQGLGVISPLVRCNR